VLTPQAKERGGIIGGKVVSFEASFPIEGVSVFIRGARQINTGTMFDGTWALELQPGDSVIVFTHEGYEARELKIEAQRSEYNVVLHER
jgi:hypothetical protein